MNLVATLIATQPVYNAAQAVHALRSDQYIVHQIIIIQLNGNDVYSYILTYQNTMEANLQQH